MKLTHRVRQLRTFEALQHREFRLLWSAQAATSLVTWMDQVARGWLIYELTNSPVQLGLVRGIQAIPILLFAPVAGSLADRYARQTQIVVAHILDGLLHTLVAVFILTGQVQPWHLYTTAFGSAVVQTLLQPARAAMLADTVPSTLLTNAIGLNSIGFNLARSTGPALAGILIATYGTAGSYVVQALCTLLALLWTMRMRPSSALRTSTGHQTPLLQSVLAGWTYSWQNEAVRIGLLIAMVAALCIAPFNTLLPVFARDLLSIGASGQGVLLTAMGVGALCSAFLIASLGHQLPRGILMLGGVLLYGLSVVAFALSSSFPLSLGLMTLVGLAHVSSHALVQTVIQTYTQAAFRGRTMAIFHMNQVVFTLGSLLVGALAALVGARWAVTMMGAIGAMLMIGLAIVQPRARSLR